VDSLHRRRRNGLTAHHALGVKVRDEALAARVVFDWPPRADAHDEARLEAMREAVANLAVQAAAVGEGFRQPVTGYQPRGPVATMAGAGG
jgi:hypothetical protein